MVGEEVGQADHGMRRGKRGKRFPNRTEQAYWNGRHNTLQTTLRFGASIVACVMFACHLLPVALRE